MLTMLLILYLRPYLSVLVPRDPLGFEHKDVWIFLLGTEGCNLIRGANLIQFLVRTYVYTSVVLFE